MDTKSKSNKTRIIIKAVCVILSVVSLMFSACFTLYTAMRIHTAGKYNIFEADRLAYTETLDFGKKFDEAVTDAVNIANTLDLANSAKIIKANRDKTIPVILESYLNNQASIIKEELQYTVRDYEMNPDDYSAGNIETAKKVLTLTDSREIIKYKSLVRDVAFDREYRYNINKINHEEWDVLLENSGLSEAVAKKEITRLFDEQVKNIENADCSYAEDMFSRLTGFSYYIRVEGNSRVITNIAEKNIAPFTAAVEKAGGADKYFEKNPALIYIAVTPEGITSKGIECFSDNGYYSDYYSTPVNLMFSLGSEFWPDNSTVYIFYNKDTVTPQKYAWDNNRVPVKAAAAAAVALFVLSIILLVISAVLSGKRDENDNVRLMFYDRIPGDIGVLLALIFFGLFVTGAAGCAAVYLFGGEFIGSSLNELQSGNLALLGAGICCALAFFVFECWLFSVIRLKKSGGKWLRRFIIFRPVLWVFRKIHKLFSLLAYKPRKLGRSVVIMICAAVLIILLLAAAIAGFARHYTGLSFICAVLLIAFCAFIAAKVLSYAKNLDRIIDSTSRGDFNIDTNGFPESLRVLGNNMQFTGEQLSRAVDKAVKDERMRTELITNVSHDLKTPLTSIINYTDLLSRCDIEDETAKGYIEVLSERSQRLKVLVEDLVEASKASSGAIQMNIERINLRELTAQVAGEMAESFEKADLDFKIILPELPVMINADGIKTCRIIENLLSNASKYSATGSRVYLTLTRDAEYGVLEIKNISATELNIPAGELMERFVRGDSSRTDGGSGLGLSIANNLAALQGGNLQLIIDGDLFKAILRLPLCGE
ncbi:MAG: HAMP domain-containing histidine kinase [Clostridia bacterium]|nr:HAMP domain-containing histidine kinase [Clostridia bacterium]